MGWRTKSPVEPRTTLPEVRRLRSRAPREVIECRQGESFTKAPAHMNWLLGLGIGLSSCRHPERLTIHRP